MTTMIIAEHNNIRLQPATLSTLAAARCFSLPITMLIIGYQCASVITEASKLADVTLVKAIDHKIYEHPLVESLIPVILNSMNHSDRIILAPSTTFGKNILPYLAAKLDVAQISDIISVIDENTVDHPIYAGNAIERVKSLDAIKIFTVRTTAFNAISTQQEPCAIERSISADDYINNITILDRIKFINYIHNQSTRPDLNSARIVVAGGRGLQSSENFKLIEELADILQAAVGASRAAVDAGFVANDCQVGQTGKIVAPELYIAIGISGAVQHLAGMKDSKIIVAINKDEDAPIMQIANYRLIGDLFVIVPQLLEGFKQIKRK